jgi:hypothetical protein
MVRLRTKFIEIPCVKDLRTLGLQCQQGVERQRVHLASKGFVQSGPLFAVQHGIIDEVGRGFRLIGRRHLDEFFLAHGLQRVVDSPLL